MSFFKTLIKNVLASYIALILFAVTIGGFIALLILGIFSSAEKALDAPEVMPENVYNIKLELNAIPDQSIQSYSWHFLNEDVQLSMFELQKALKHIGSNKNVNKIIIRLNDLPGGLSNYSALSPTIDSLAKQKKVLVYSDNYDLQKLLLSRSSTQRIMHPLGNVELKGIGTQIIYFHEMLNKIGIEAEPIRAGKYKSAIEPYILDSMSTYNKIQLSELLNDLWNQSKNDLSTAYKVPNLKLEHIANESGYLLPSELMTNNFIDTLMTWDEVLSGNRTIQLWGISDYIKFFNSEIYPSSAKSKIALLTLEGIIQSGSDEEMIASRSTTKYLREIHQDTSIKALVIRINSPGGSAMASETIFKAIERVNRSIPVVISMGDLAASGGYYISCASNYIFAEPYTITGSIGVYGLMMNIGKLKEKLGLNFEKVQTNNLSDFPSFDRSLSEKEKALLQKSIDATYAIFLKRVAKGRSISIEKANELGQGRVWSAKQALDNGLIDTIGGLNLALDKASELSKTEKYAIVVYPKAKNFLEKLKEKANPSSIKIALPKALEELSQHLLELQQLSEMNSPQMRLPFYIRYK